MIRMMILMMMMMGMTMMMEGAIGINMTIRQEAGTLNWSCVGGRDVALLTTGCGNKEIVAQIVRITRMEIRMKIKTRMRMMMKIRLRII